MLCLNDTHLRELQAVFALDLCLTYNIRYIGLNQEKLVNATRNFRHLTIKKAPQSITS